MQIETGLFDNMVLQRNRAGISESTVTGTCAAEGRLVAVVKARGRTSDAATVRVGRASAGRFKGVLKGIKTGGPYAVTLQVLSRRGEVLESAHAGNVLVGDVWVAAGQSNMQGAGLVKDGPAPHPMSRAFYMDDQWRVADDPIHNMWACVDQVHIDLCGGARPQPAAAGSGCPAVTFAHEMHRYTGVPQGVIASAHGGTNMPQWDPALAKDGPKSLYGATLRRIAKNGGRIAGVIWYQGEAETHPDGTVPYTDRMKRLIQALRRDTRTPSLPFALVQLGRVAAQSGTPAHWNAIQHQQYELPRKIGNCTFITANDVDLSDDIHLTMAGYITVGKRLAYAVNALVNGPKAGKPPLRLKRVRMVRNWTYDLELEFENVVGRLSATGRPTGLSILNSAAVDHVCSTRLDGNKVILHTNLSRYTLNNKMLHNGYGFTPYCNIYDGAGRPLPVFGPVTTTKPRALGPLIATVRYSRFFPSAGKLHAVEYPADRQALGLQSRSFPFDFCGLHNEMYALAPEDVLVYYACDFECRVPMKIRASLGYDGPVKAWLDGRQVFHDPAGTNPSTADMATSDTVELTAGRHELMVALGSNGGNAWGVWLALERMDLPPETILKGPAYWDIPTALG